jgi:peptide/nickel transport system ATP-binding protein
MFETPCSTDEPELRRTEAGEIACHIHDPAYEGEPGGLPTDDGNDKKLSR